MRDGKSVSETFAERLIALRRQHGVKQAALARELNFSGASLSAYERGICEPSIGTACRIAEYFGVSIAYLVGEDSVAGTATEELAEGLLEAKQHDMALSFMRSMREAIKKWEDTYCG